MDMSYIMDSGQNRLYTTFTNIFSLISADPADLSKCQKNRIFEKTNAILTSKISSRDVKTGPIGKLG